jgi:hypothetical protein
LRIMDYKNQINDAGLDAVIRHLLEQRYSDFTHSLSSDVLLRRHLFSAGAKPLVQLILEHVSSGLLYEPPASPPSPAPAMPNVDPKPAVAPAVRISPESSTRGRESNHSPESSRSPERDRSPVRMPLPPLRIKGNMTEAHWVELLYDQHCTLCNRTFGDNAEFFRHWITAHPDKSAYLCEQCKFGYRSKKELDRHTAWHEKRNVPLFHCEKCPQEFTHKHSLTTHKRAHGNIMGKYRCGLCDWSTRTSTSMRTHQTAHALALALGRGSSTDNQASEPRQERGEEAEEAQ